MTLFTHLRRIWTERRIRVLSVDLARARDELDDLEAAYRYDRYERDLHYAIIDERERIKALEAARIDAMGHLASLA